MSRWITVPKLKNMCGFCVIPYLPLLGQPPLREVCRVVKGKFISGEVRSGTLFGTASFYSHFSLELVKSTSPNTLVAAVGEQSELLVACAGDEDQMNQFRSCVAGILLVDGIAPKEHITRMLQQRNIPVILTDMPAFEATGNVAGMIAKIQPDNPEKITAINKLFQEYVAIDRLIDKVS
jgi:BioD-like phosphotransacetylase family protein